MAESFEEAYHLNIFEINKVFLANVRSLQSLIGEVQTTVTNSPFDGFCATHINFLTKSFLINLCCSVELFLKDLVTERIRHYDEILKLARIPHNIFQWSEWSEAGKPKEKNLNYAEFRLKIDGKRVDSVISPNPFKTIECFQLIGIDLLKYEKVKNNKELINSLVQKRNKIIHYNDSATDISLGDVLQFINTSVEYSQAIVDAMKLAD